MNAEPDPHADKIGYLEDLIQRLTDVRKSIKEDIEMLRAYQDAEKRRLLKD